MNTKVITTLRELPGDTCRAFSGKTQEEAERTFEKKYPRCDSQEAYWLGALRTLYIPWRANPYVAPTD